VDLLSDQAFNLNTYWTWFLLSVRTASLFTVLPGIGTSEIPATYRFMLSLMLAYALTLSGITSVEPSSMAEAGLMIGSEIMLGFMLGTVPFLIIQSLSIAGQLVAGSIGLSFPSMIDPSTQQAVPVLSSIKILVGTLVFLQLNGHHVVFRALAEDGPRSMAGVFNPNADIMQIYLLRFVAMFELSITIAGPVVVAALLAQLVLGLVTKAVPSVNVFIVSLPLTIGLGLYLTAFNLPGMVEKLTEEFAGMDEVLARITANSTPRP